MQKTSERRVKSRVIHATRPEGGRERRRVDPGRSPPRRRPPRQLLRRSRRLLALQGTRGRGRRKSPPAHLDRSAVWHRTRVRRRRTNGLSGGGAGGLRSHDDILVISLECGSRSCRFCMSKPYTNIQKRRLRPPHSKPLIPRVRQRLRSRRSPSLVPRHLEIERFARAGVVADLVHGGGVEDAAVDDGVAHRVGVADVLERVGVEDDEVGELARLQRADLAGRVRGNARRRGWRRGAPPAASCRPARTSTSPSARRGFRAGRGRRVGPSRRRRAASLATRATLRWLNSSSGAITPAARARVEDAPRHERRQPLVLPDVRLLVPVVLAQAAAVGDDQRGRVADLRLPHSWVTSS